ncbi:phage holin family protein [Sphingomicrobium sp. XHP0239]|uniref:phage holin family protein n=1 Tax=Sphingomicrobium maritimum TaxID=3133972 RepID=UPI0031CCC954
MLDTSPPKQTPQVAPSERDREVPDPQAPLDPDKSIGELIGRIVEDGRELVGAEVSLARAKAMVEARRYKKSAMLFGVAFVFAVAALVAFAVGMTLALATIIGPLLGGLVATILFLGIAAVVARAGAKRLEDGE